MTEIRPKTRIHAIATEANGNELLIHDGERNHFHTLNGTAAAVWHACDGTLTPDEIAKATGFDRAIVDYALDELAERGLLAQTAGHSGLSRRDVVRKLAAAGVAGAVALPVIASITGESAAAAGSCTTSEQCPAESACVGGVCGPCIADNLPCAIDADCCGGFCVTGSCLTL